MTKILSLTSLDFGTVTINQTSTKTATVYNLGTERVLLDGVISNDPVFTPQPITQSNLMPQFPKNSTIYFDSLGRIQTEAGAYITTSQGYGYCGTTNALRELTVNVVTQMLSLIDPVDGININANSAVVINWTFQNITSIDLDYSFDGLNWVNIVNDYSAGFGTYNWTTPEIFSDKSITLRIKGGIKEDSHNLTLKADLSSWIIGTATANKTDIVTVPNNEEFSISATANKTDIVTVPNNEEFSISATATKEDVAP